MKIRFSLLLTLCLAACAGNPATSAPTLAPTGDATLSVIAPTAAPKQLLFIEFFAIH